MASFAARVRHALFRWTPSGRLRDELGRRDRAIVEREATVREREATIVAREATIRELEEALAERSDEAAARRARITVIEPAKDAAPRGVDGVGAETDRRGPLDGRVRAAIPRIEGWCTERKALWLADLIARDRCKDVLEIGIFGGRSLIPMAMAVQALGAGGRVFGVEAWSNSVAVATETHDENDDWWQKVDMKAIKTGFLAEVVRNDVADTVIVLEMSSDEAFATIAATGVGPFDLVHVDGSHSAEQALRDVKQWSSVVRPGGIIVLDDITPAWPGVLAARDHLLQTFSKIEEILESDTVGYGAYRRPAPDAAHSRPS